MFNFKASAKPAASIVVIGLRDAPTLLRCLHSVAATVTGVTYEVRVVLCDPTERTRRELEREVTGAHISPFKGNLGFAGAANFAASQAVGDYIVLLNDDCVVSPGWLESLIDTAKRRPRCGIVSGTYLHPDGRLQEAGSVLWSDGTTHAVGDGMEPGYMGFERRVIYASAGSMLVRREVWDLLGGLPEVYYPAYYEDLDFCLSAAGRGLGELVPAFLGCRPRPFDKHYSYAAIVHLRGRPASSGGDGAVCSLLVNRPARLSELFGGE